MSTPETNAPEAPPPAPSTPAPPMPPPPLDEGVSLLSQAFELAGALGHTLLAAQIGGGLSRLQQLLRRVAVLEQQLASTLSVAKEAVAFAQTVSGADPRMLQRADEQAPPPSEPTPAA
jgi:hypothetical protein